MTSGATRARHLRLGLLVFALALPLVSPGAATAQPPASPVFVPPPRGSLLVYQSEAPALEGAPVIVYRSRLVTVGYDHFYVPPRTVATIATRLGAVIDLRLEREDPNTLWAPDRYARQLGWRRVRRRGYEIVEIRSRRECYGRRECAQARRGDPPEVTRLIRTLDALARRLLRSRARR